MSERIKPLSGEFILLRRTEFNANCVWRGEKDVTMKKRHPAADGFDWRRPHHSPLFWFGTVLFLAAIVYYLWSQDLSTRPSL